MKNSKRDATYAYHEAGHVVAAWRLELDLDYATILPDGEFAGHIKIKPEDPSTYAAIERGDRWDPARLRAEKLVMLWQAGEVAQRLYNSYSVRRRHSQDDRKQCDDILRKYAPDEKKLDVRPHYNLLRNWTAHLIAQHWHLVKAVAKALLERRELSDAQILDVICTADEKSIRANIQLLVDAVRFYRQWREGVRVSVDAQTGH